MIAPWRGPVKVLLALVVGGLGALAGAAGGLSGPASLPAGETEDIYWMSGVIQGYSACVGVLGLHGSNAYDLIADDSGPCYGPVSTEVRLRETGRSSVTHVALSAYIQSVRDPYPSGCDYIEASAVQQPSGVAMGNYFYVHASGPGDYWVDLWAGPALPGTDVSIGATTDDSNCAGGWTGYHTHQYADSAYSQPNDPDVLVANQPIVVWDLPHFIHRWTYAVPDTDGDGYTDTLELYVGTDTLDNCPDNSLDAAWPPDMNNDRWANVLDLLMFKPHWHNCRLGQACYSKRYDLTGSTLGVPDGIVNVLDMIVVVKANNQRCT